MSDIEKVMPNTVAIDELPVGWKSVRIGNIVNEMVGGCSTSKSDYLSEGILVLNKGHIKENGIVDVGNLKRYVSIKYASNNSGRIVNVDTVLVTLRDLSMKADFLGLIGKYRGTEKALITQGMCSLDLSELVIPNYLVYYSNSPIYRVAVKQKKVGSTQVHLRNGEFLDIQIPLAPLNEQTRIVAEIEKQFSRLDEAVANLKRVKANLKRYKAAVLKAAVEGKLTEEWRKQHPDVEPADKLLERILAERRKAAGKGKYKEPVAPDTSGLLELPAGWVWASPAQLSSGDRYSLAIGPFGSNLKVSDYKTSGVPLVFVRNIRANDFGGDNTVYVTAEKADELRAHQVTGGDLLITKMGAPPGDVCLYPESRPDAVITADCIKLRLVSSLLNKLFFLRAIESKVIKNQILGVTKGVAQLKVSLERFSTIGLPLPPLVEQLQIVAEVERRLSIVAGAEAQVDANLRRADRLRQSILKQSFSGQLVPQDPNDEPASVLLERIRVNASVGANKYSPLSVTRKPKRAIHESPVRKPPQPAEPKPAASANFVCLDDVTAVILAAMQSGREYACVEIADVLGLSTGRWNAAIQDLKRHGGVRQMGERKGTKYMHFDWRKV